MMEADRIINDHLYVTLAEARKMGHRAFTRGFVAGCLFTMAVNTLILIGLYT